MKNLFYLLLIICMISLTNSSCERQPAALDPPLGLYKTNSDYFSFYAPSTNDKGEIVGYDYFKEGDSRILITEDDTIFSYRVNLNDGYVLSAEVYPDAPFTNVSYKELYRRQNTDSPIGTEILQNRIIDTNPFIDYYEVDINFVTPFIEHFHDLGYSMAEGTYLGFQEAAKEINQIIAQDKLDESFTRIK
ncbi:MAG: hypothetical protein R6U04_04915 [Bacteroidales bacterium]